MRRIDQRCGLCGRCGRSGFVENDLGLGKGVRQIAPQLRAIIPDEKGDDAARTLGTRVVPRRASP
jgi:hypothetical protein